MPRLLSLCGLMSTRLWSFHLSKGTTFIVKSIFAKMTMLKGLFFYFTAQFIISSDKKRIDPSFQYAEKSIFLLSYIGGGSCAFPNWLVVSVFVSVQNISSTVNFRFKHVRFKEVFRFKEEFHCSQNFST